MQKKSWSKIVAAAGKQVYLVQLSEKEGGRKLFYCILVEKPKERSFVRTLEKGEGTINLDDYGEVIASDYGEPSEELLQYLREKYNAAV